MGTSAKSFFTLVEQADIRQAITAAEHETSGEIRVHLETSCRADVLDRAAQVFKWLKMEKTELRNGVLIYLSVKDRKFAIIGDKGINSVVPPDFWDKTKDEMLNRFRAGKFAEGLVYGISETGHHLKKFFPHKKDDINELSDDISFGKQ
jgi:uncharacterized membrane protein